MAANQYLRRDTHEAPGVVVEGVLQDSEAIAGTYVTTRYVTSASGDGNAIVREKGLDYPVAVLHHNSSGQSAVRDDERMPVGCRDDTDPCQGHGHKAPQYTPSPARLATS